MNAIRPNSRQSRVLAIAVAALMVLLAAKLMVIPVFTYLANHEAAVGDLALEVARLGGVANKLPDRKRLLERQEKSDAERKLIFNGLSSGAAGAALERAVVTLIRSNNLPVSQSRIQPQSKAGDLEAVVVTVAFSASHEELISVLNGLQQLKPAATVDSLRITVGTRFDMQTQPAAPDDGGGPYNGDHILGVDLVVRALANPSGK